ATPFAAPGLGIIAAAIMLGFGLWWLRRAEGAARRAGEGYGKEASVTPDRAAGDELVRERATTAREFDPAELHHGDRSASAPPALFAALPLVVVVNLLMSLVVLPRLDFSFPCRRTLGRTLDFWSGWRMVRGGRARRRHCHRHTLQPWAPFFAATKHGCRRQCFHSAGSQCREPRRIRRRDRRAARFLNRTRLGAGNRGR